MKDADTTGRLKSDTGVITLARFPTGRAIIVCVKSKTKVTTLARSQFVFIRLVGRHLETQLKT